MTTLTLPIVVGKKYVRRDGKVITAQHYTDELTSVVFDGEPRTFSRLAFSKNGSIGDGNYESEADLVSDYIEPVKGHPHASLMMEFAKDAAECETPWDRWECQWQYAEDWKQLQMPPIWNPDCGYRRKPTVNPDPHAENAAEYAKDMAETDKAWERWEMDFANAQQERWTACREHPGWSRGMKYRRKGSL